MSSSEMADRFEVRVERDVRIPTSDPEVSLSADLFLPVLPNPGPALVMVLPYRKDFTVGSDLEASIRWFAQRGYASLIANLRGIGSSDGTPRPKFHAGEGDDVVDVVEWVEQQEWCDGRVGMWGHSSGAFLTLRGASRRPRGLKAVLALQCPLDPGREAVHHDGARVDLHQRALWSGAMLLDQLVPPLHDPYAVAERHRWHRHLYETEPFLLDMARGPEDPVWAERKIDPTSIAVPTLLVGGWRDLYARGIIEAYERIDAPKRLLIGPWMHTYPHRSPFVPIDFLGIALEWWDHWLRDLPNAAMSGPPVVAYTAGADAEWRGYDAWPPKGIVRTLSARASGELVMDDEAAEQDGVIAEYQPDPTIGIYGGLGGVPNPGIGLPLDQHLDDAKSIAFTTAALEETVELAGSIDVALRFEPDSPPPQRVIVRLTEVDDMGRSSAITFGVVTGAELGSEVAVSLRPIAYRVAAGRRLRLTVNDSDFPRLTPLVDAPPMYVTSIRASLPTTSRQFSDPVVVHQMQHADTHEAASGRWRVEQDLVHDQTTVSFGWSSVGVLTAEGHRVDRHTDISATVRRDAPAAALTIGEHNARIEYQTGETITASAVVRCGRASMWARGTVVVDGVRTYERVWEVPLND